MDTPDPAIRDLRDALVAGELGPADLTARRLSAYLGKTTGALYHRWGSVDVLLHRVGQDGALLLGAQLVRHERLDDMAAAFVGWGLDHPVLYGLLLERKYDWPAMQRACASGELGSGLQLWDAVVARLGAEGSDDPAGDARILLAGLHGLVSLAASGRANLRQVDHTDREVAQAAARTLARRLCPRLEDR